MLGIRKWFREPPGNRVLILLPVLIWLFGLGAACGEGYTDLVVQLVPVAGEDPFDGLDTIRVTVERERPGNPVIVQTVQLPTQDLELATVPNQGVVRVLVDGFSDSVPGTPLAEGRSAWIQPKSGERLQVQVCFCKKETVDVGGCVCP